MNNKTIPLPHLLALSVLPIVTLLCCGRYDSGRENAVPVSWEDAVELRYAAHGERRHSLGRND